MAVLFSIARTGNTQYYFVKLGIPDPFVQEPDNPQSFNRYSYTINNPQKYVDPSGHFFGLIFSLVFRSAIASKLTAAADPWGFLLSKIPKKVNGGINIFGGVLMMISGNPAGAFYMASGAMSFGKGSGFDIASQVLEGIGTVASLGAGPNGTGGINGGGPEGNNFLASYASTPGDDFPNGTGMPGDMRAMRDILLLSRLLFAATKDIQQMKKVGSLTRNRVLGLGFGFPKGSYEAVIYQRGSDDYYQFREVDSPEWRKAENLSSLTGKGEAEAYSHALTVSEEIYYGAIPDQTGGAVMFHSQGANTPRSFQILLDKGRIQETVQEGNMRFYRQLR